MGCTWLSSVRLLKPSPSRPVPEEARAGVHLRLHHRSLNAHLLAKLVHNDCYAIPMLRRQNIVHERGLPCGRQSFSNVALASALFLYATCFLPKCLGSFTFRRAVTCNRPVVSQCIIEEWSKCQRNVMSLKICKGAVTCAKKAGDESDWHGHQLVLTRFLCALILCFSIIKSRAQLNNYYVCCRVQHLVTLFAMRDCFLWSQVALA